MAQTTASAPTAQTDKPSTKTKSKDRMQDVVSATQESVDTVAQSVKETATHVADTTADAAHTFQSEFDGAVRRNPTLAVLGAVGVGVLIGMALNKRA